MDLNSTMRGLEIFSRIQPDMQLTTLRVFLFVAQRGKCNQADIENYLGISRAAVSRNVDYWTNLKFDNREGINFLCREEDPSDRRNKLVKLTEKGQTFYERLRGIDGTKTR